VEQEKVKLDCYCSPNNPVLSGTSTFTSWPTLLTVWKVFVLG
jgi:hypothetical protein